MVVIDVTDVHLLINYFIKKYFFIFLLYIKDRKYIKRYATLTSVRTV